MENELNLQEVGRRILQRRKQMGLTQEQLAEKADVTTQFVSYAESGKRGMRPENLQKMAVALEVSSDYLLNGTAVDTDRLLLSDKLRRLSPTQLHIVESIVDECLRLFDPHPDSQDSPN